MAQAHAVAMTKYITFMLYMYLLVNDLVVRVTWSVHWFLQGEATVAEMWQTSGLQWTSFVPSTEVHAFLSDRKLDWLENVNVCKYMYATVMSESVTANSSVYCNKRWQYTVFRKKHPLTFSIITLYGVFWSKIDEIMMSCHLFAAAHFY